MGRAVRHPAAPDRWRAIGRDEVLLPSDETADGLYATADAALIQARGAWRRRTVTVSDALGEDYWIEPRPTAGLESLWLGRIHLGYIRPRSDGTCEAFTTNDEPIKQPTYPTCQEGLLAVRSAWRTHLRRILRIDRQPC